MLSFLKELAPPDEAQAILNLCKNVEEAIKVIPPTITEEEVKQELQQINLAVNSWANRDDIKVRGLLSALRCRIARLYELKTKGTAAFAANPQISLDLDEIVRRCKAVGLFLVLFPLHNFRAS